MPCQKPHYLIVTSQLQRQRRTTQELWQQLSWQTTTLAAGYTLASFVFLWTLEQFNLFVVSVWNSWISLGFARRGRVLIGRGGNRRLFAVAADSL